MYCNRCNAEVTDQSGYCPRCGTPLVLNPTGPAPVMQPAADTGQSSSNSPASNKTVTIAVVAIIAAIVLLILMVPFFNGFAAGGSSSGPAVESVTETVGTLGNGADNAEGSSAVPSDAGSVTSGPDSGSATAVPAPAPSQSAPDTSAAGGGSSAPAIIGSPEEIVRESFEALYDGNFEVLLNNMPQPALEYFASEMGMTLDEALNRASSISSLYNMFSGIAGDYVSSQLPFDVDIDVEAEDFTNFVVSSATSMSASELEALKSSWNQRVPGFGDTFQEGALVPVSVGMGGLMKGYASLFGSATGTDIDTEQTSEAVDIPCVLIDNRWYIIETGPE